LSAKEIDNIWQDAVNAQVLELAKQFMQKSNILAHPKHEEEETDLLLWKERSESIKQN
jgi:hypothetical protein